MSFLLVLALLQAPPTPGTVRGVVTTADSTQPLPLARVELIGGALPVVTRTNEAGEFSFGNLPPGSYRVSVKKEGFVRQEYGERLPAGPGKAITVEAGAQTPELHFRLLAASTFEGAVRNAENEPIGNILVQALRRTYDIQGKRTITPFASALSNDRGEYRLYWLDPGEYFINASYVPQLPTGNAIEEAPRIPYAPTYYPGFANPAEASAVVLESGRALRGIDFRLERAPAVEVQGTVYSTVSRTGVPAIVTLMPSEESGGIARYTIRTNERGAFVMQSVNPGSYILLAKTLSGDGQIGSSTIRVDNVDYLKADVAVGFGAAMTVRFPANGIAPAAVLPAQIRLVPVESYLPEPAAANIQRDGRVSISGIQPGTYALRVGNLTEDAYVRSARADSQDVLESLLIVGDEIPARLDIEIASDGGRISGTVVDAGGNPVENGSVVLVPGGSRRHRLDLYRTATAARDGTFTIRGIPPGEYKLFSWEAVEINAHLNADFMRPYEDAGAAVQIAPGATVTGQIRIIPRQ